jgi:hypothetical protein
MLASSAQRQHWRRAARYSGNTLKVAEWGIPLARAASRSHDPQGAGAADVSPACRKGHGGRASLFVAGRQQQILLFRTLREKVARSLTLAVQWPHHGLTEGYVG